MSTLRPLVLALICACTSAQSMFSCPNGNNYRVLATKTSQPLALANAYQEHYQGVQGHLVTIESSSEAACMSEHLPQDTNGWYWIGAGDEVTESTWRWLVGPNEGDVLWRGDRHGSAPAGTFANWEPSQPQADNLRENCVGVTTGGLWHDYPCVDPRNLFLTVVEFETGGDIEGFELAGVGACRTEGPTEHFRVIRYGERCSLTIGDMDLGDADSEATCAAKCSARAGCEHVLYGYGRNRNQCIQTSFGSCTSWESAQFDLISLDMHAQASMGSYSNVVINSLNDCATACSNSDICVAFEYSNNSNALHCELHRVPVTRVLGINEVNRTVLCYDKVQIEEEWRSAGENVCVQADGLNYAEFEVPDSLLAHQIKLVRRTGNISCYNWIHCANNSATCTCTGTARYGQEGQWTYHESDGTIDCSSEAFGAGDNVGNCQCRGAGTLTGVWGCASQSNIAVYVYTRGGQVVVPARDDQHISALSANSGYHLTGFDYMSEEIALETPGSALPLAPGNYRLGFGVDLGGSGVVCMDIYIYSSPDEAEWNVVTVENPGVGLGQSSEALPMRTLNFPSLDASLQSGDYYVRLSWGSSDFMQFHVPTGSDIFSQVETLNIEVDEVLSSSDTVRFSEEAYFCHACVSGGSNQYGDTCWGVLPLTDNHRECGCNSGGWVGEGIYYGGHVQGNQNVCGGHGGGFAGPKLTSQAKGGLRSIGLTLSIRSRCADRQYYNASLSRCFSYSVCTADEFESSRPSWNANRVCSLCTNTSLCRQNVKGYWQFDGGVNGDIVSGTDATTESIPSSSAHPVMSTVPHGNGQALVVQGNARLNTNRWLPSGPKTITFSISTHSFSTPQTWLNQTGSSLFAIGVFGGRLFISAGETQVPATFLLYDTRPDIFHPFAVVDDGEGTMTIYEDGHALGEVSYVGETNTAVPGTLFIGGVGSYNIDDVKVAGTALNASTIVNLAGPSASYNHPPDSSEWQLVFRHDTSHGPMWSNGTWSMNANSANPESESQFSRLDQLEQYRSHDGYLTFKMVWPRLCSQTTCVTGENQYIIWRQRSNPTVQPTTTTGHVDGYEELNVGYWAAREARVGFGGLEYNGNQALLDGNVDHTNWWYAVGSIRGYPSTTSHTFPGPKRDNPEVGIPTDLVELYIFDYSYELGETNACGGHTYSKLGNACCRSSGQSEIPVRDFTAEDVAHCRDLCDREGAECQGFEFRPNFMSHECQIHLGPLDHVEFEDDLDCSCYVRVDSNNSAAISTVYYNSTTQTCQSLTVCVPQREYEVVAATSTSDRQCRSCTSICDEGYYPVGTCEATSGPNCVPCEAGYACDGRMMQQCNASYFSGAQSSTCTHCSNLLCVGAGAGSYTTLVDNLRVRGTCPCGYYCPVRSIEKIACPANTYTNVPGQSECHDCVEDATSVQGSWTCVSISGMNISSTELCGMPDTVPPPTTNPTAPVTMRPTSIGVSVRLTTTASVGLYPNISCIGSWNWDQTTPMTPIDSSHWYMDLTLSPGSYQWYAVYGDSRLSLLDPSENFCGNDPTIVNRGGFCNFRVATDRQLSGALTITANLGSPGQLPFTPSTPPTRSPSQESPFLQLPKSKDGNGAVVGIIIGLLLAVCIVGGVIYYYKRKISRATVVITKTEDGELVGTLSFSNPSYDDDEPPTSGTGYSKVATTNTLYDNNDDDDDILLAD